mgnify:CR=1 FL=1
MKEPFDIILNEIEYSVFPEENGIYTVFKDGVEYVKIQEDENDQWLKLDPETELPLFLPDEEVNAIGREIKASDQP